MAKKAEETSDRVIMLAAGESGSGKSFWVANLKNALIFDTDIGGGLTYADERITRNGSERIEVGSYLEVIEEMNKRKKNLDITTLAIDHLSTLHQEAVLRYNPTLIKDFGSAADKAAKEWRKIRELVRWGDYNLVCTAHLKGKWENDKAIGEQADAAKKIEGDFHVVLHVHNTGGNVYPKNAEVMKWRRDPEDKRGKVPAIFPFTMEEFLKIHGASMEGKRHEILMATPEQISELNRLLGVVKLPEGTAEKWLAKAKAESFEEMTQEIIVKCIDYARKLVADPAA